MKEYLPEKNTWAFVREFKMLEALSANDSDDNAAVLTEDISIETDAAFREKASQLVSPFNLNIQTGQIRLLSQTDKLTYAVVLPWSWSHSLIVPFSHCANPATDGELYSDGEERGLFQQVFQVWNARTINRAILARSWVMGEVSQADLERLNKMLQHNWLDGELPEDIRNMTGVPLLEGYDIRRKFLQEELDNFAALDAEDASLDLSFESIEDVPINRQFNVLQKTKVAEKLLAASGNNNLSEAYIMIGDELNFLQGVELTDFEPVKAQSPMPDFCWVAENLPDSCTENMVVIFRYRESGDTIGSGCLIKQNYGWEIVLANAVDSENVPAINSPADIQLIFIGK
ncbi:MAG: hypothetical protein IJZ19_01420 [Lentisphaeria bacterium]|nr:hypothetical protein [Lentisphaeria bacterium]